MAWLHERTEDGVEIEIPTDPYAASRGGFERDLVVHVDGKRVQVTGRVSRLRDGGTTTIPTEVGEIIIPTPFRPGPPRIRRP